MEVRVEGESNSVTRLIRGRDSDGAQLYPPPGREPTWLILQPHTEGREEEVAGFFGRPSFLPSDQDFVTPIEMDSDAASAL